MTMNHYELLKKINPVYISAKGCLFLLAETGEPDIMRFYHAIDKEQLTVSGTAIDPQITLSRVISLEARFHMWNVIAKETDCKTIVDLPCGYLPHCLEVARLKKKYYGLDLPIVTNEVSSVAFKHIAKSERHLVQYHGVDATNYASMRTALKDVQGKICIITDGFLGYFNYYDLKAVCKNIHRLLQEFGGCWYTSDSQFTDLMAITYAVLTGGNKNDILEANNAGVNRLSNVDNSDHVFIAGTLEERRHFLEECGFFVKSFHYPDKLKKIPSLQDNPALMERVISAYQEIEEWILTAEGTNSVEKQEFELHFSQDLFLKDNVLSIRICGRLDTITAPELLQKYEEQRAKDAFIEIEIDATELSYVSYAGLRVFRIMCESLEDSSRFKIRNVNDELKKILMIDFPNTR